MAHSVNTTKQPVIESWRCKLCIWCRGNVTTESWCFVKEIKKNIYQISSVTRWWCSCCNLGWWM